MSSMGKTVLKKIGGHEVVCRELTVAEVRGLMQQGVSGDLVEDLLFEEVRLGDLLRLTNLTKEQLDEMLPSDLRAVVDGCKEANPDFFAMLARLSKPPKAS